MGLPATFSNSRYHRPGSRLFPCLHYLVTSLSGLSFGKIRGRENVGKWMDSNWEILTVFAIEIRHFHELNDQWILRLRTFVNISMWSNAAGNIQKEFHYYSTIDQILDNLWFSYGFSTIAFPCSTNTFIMRLRKNTKLSSPRMSQSFVLPSEVHE
jgi:hypothetical protein